MKINLHIDPSGNVEAPTLVLCYKSGERIGAINNVEDLRLSDEFENPVQFTFNVHKRTCDIFYKIKDFRLIWIPEWDLYFELYTNLQESTSVIKSIRAVHICEAELAQLDMHEVEINTEDDIDYNDHDKATIFWDPENTDTSLLHRVLHDKAINYEVMHVDETLWGMQRSFSFDKTNVLGALHEIEQTFGCHFNFESSTNYDGTIRRMIYVYDMQSVCNNNECSYLNEPDNIKKIRYRGDFTYQCPHCGSKNIIHGYGEDTTIFFSIDNVIDEIDYDTDVDSVKTCFWLDGGDEFMTDTIRNCLPSGGKYIWYFSDDMKADMTEELQNALALYDEAEEEAYTKTYLTDPDVVSKINNVNQVINKYIFMDTSISEGVINPISIEGVPGYAGLMTIYYDLIDMDYYIEDGLLPRISNEQETTSAQKEIDKINLKNNEISMTSISTYTANSVLINAVKQMVRVYVDSSKYNITVTLSNVSKNTSSITANVNIRLDNVTQVYLTDKQIEESGQPRDSAEASYSIVFNTNTEKYLDQMLTKSLSDSRYGKDPAYSISSLFNDDTSLEIFKESIKKYGLVPLQSLLECADGARSVLNGLQIGQENYAEGSVDGEVYKKVTEGIYKRLVDKIYAINDELAIREEELSVIRELEEKIQEIKSETNAYLDLRNFFKNINSDDESESLWKEFTAYRRDDTYSNSNFISDDLTNAEMMANAKEFIETARKELIKSATLQHSIRTSIKNLFTIKEFAPMREYFACGNWLRVAIDGEVYRLRLIEYDIDFNNLTSGSVQFSDVIKGTDISDLENLLNTANDMASSYSYFQEQASAGDDANSTLVDFRRNGLSATQMKIINNADDQTAEMTRYGMLFRSKDPFSGFYSDEQMKIINSTIVFTDNKWDTIKTALGKIVYQDPDTEEYSYVYGLSAEVVVGDLIVGKTLKMRNVDASMTFDRDGLNINNNVNSISINPNSSNLFSIQHNNIDIMKTTETGDIDLTGHLHANSLSTGGKDSSISGSAGLFVDNQGNLYSGPSNQTILHNDGRFSFGGANGITYDGTNVKFGSNVILTWGDISDKPDNLATTDDIPEYEGFTEDEIKGFATTITNNAIQTGGLTANNLTITGTSSLSGITATDLTVNGSSTFNGTIYADGDSTFAGTLSGADGTFSGQLSAATGTFSGTLQAASGTFDSVIGSNFTVRDSLKMDYSSAGLEETDVLTYYYDEQARKMAVMLASPNDLVVYANGILQLSAGKKVTVDGYKVLTDYDSQKIGNVENTGITTHLDLVNGNGQIQVVAGSAGGRGLRVRKSNTDDWTWLIHKDKDGNVEIPGYTGPGTTSGITESQLKEFGKSKFTVDKTGYLCSYDEMVNYVSSNSSSGGLNVNANGNLIIGSSTYTENHVQVQAKSTKIHLRAEDGKGGVYDYGNSRWIVCRDDSGALYTTNPTTGGTNGILTGYNWQDYVSGKCASDGIKNYDKTGYVCKYDTMTKYVNNNAVTISSLTGGRTNIKVSSSAEVSINAGGWAGLYSGSYAVWFNSSGTAYLSNSIISASNSDRRMKNELGFLSDFEAYTILSGINIAKFRYKDEKLNFAEEIGIYAQDLRDLLLRNGFENRSYIRVDEDRFEGDSFYDITLPETGYKYSVDYKKFIPLLWKGWQIHDNKIESYSSTISELKSENTKLKAKCEQLQYMFEQLITRVTKLEQG